MHPLTYVLDRTDAGSLKAEEQGFSRFHLYVCAAFLVKWSDQLVKMDFQVCSTIVPQCSRSANRARKS